jgi:CheY-like chemotaxis protein/Flp pilus assembly protein TadD
MALEDEDLSKTQALIIDGNHSSRAILVNQLRDFGIGNVEQVSRTSEARRILERRHFDIILCEQNFQPDEPSGQDFLDDLRRHQLISFSTIFIMVTSESSPAKVAEAAESALDGYLIKPHTAARLAERLEQARQRKAVLAPIFEAIESNQHEKAANLCMERFETKGAYWLYTARIGAELLIRLQRYEEAQRLYEAIINAKTVPWAKLGVARSQLGRGETQRAVGTLETLISEEPHYADAYDVMGRAQFELGNHEQTLAAYKMACMATPYSVTRLQSLGHLHYYKGEYHEAEHVLNQCVNQGLGTRSFDPQTLMLLGFIYMMMDDRQGLHRIRGELAKIGARESEYTQRQRTMEATLNALMDILRKEYGLALKVARDHARRIREPDFDAESASNLIFLLSQIGSRTVSLDLDLSDFPPVLDTLGARFISGRSMSELLAGAARTHAPYADYLRAAGERPIKLMEDAVKLSMGGDPVSAVRELIKHGQETLNARLITTAQLVLQRYQAQIPEAATYLSTIQDWRRRYGGATLRTTLTLGSPSDNREAGGIPLPVPKKAGVGAH